MSSLLSHLRHSLSVLIANPGFTKVAVAALALGMGANTAIFSVVNTVLLAPLPYPQSDRIMRIDRGFKGQPGNGGGATSIPKFMAWKNANQTFQAMAVYDFAGPGLNLGAGGRTFLPQEDLPNVSTPKTTLLLPFPRWTSTS